MKRIALREERREKTMRTKKGRYRVKRVNVCLDLKCIGEKEKTQQRIKGRG